MIGFEGLLQNLEERFNKTFLINNLAHATPFCFFDVGKTESSHRHGRTRVLNCQLIKYGRTFDNQRPFW